VDAADERPGGCRRERRELGDVRAAAEGAAASAEHDDAQAFIARKPLERRGELFQQRGIESIDLLRAVEEDARHRVITLELHHAFIL